MIIPQFEDNSGNWQKAAIRLSNKIRMHVNNTNLDPTLMKGHNRVNKTCIITNGNLSGSLFLGSKRKEWYEKPAKYSRFMIILTSLVTD